MVKYTSSEDAKVSRVYFCLYELLGTAVITTAYNLGIPVYLPLFVVTLWAWDMSSAHFNFGLTVAACLFNTKYWKQNSLEFAQIALSQIFGALLGIVLTIACS